MHVSYVDPKKSNNKIRLKVLTEKAAEQFYI